MIDLKILECKYNYNKTEKNCVLRSIRDVNEDIRFLKLKNKVVFKPYIKIKEDVLKALNKKIEKLDIENKNLYRQIKDIRKQLTFNLS